MKRRTLIKNAFILFITFGLYKCSRENDSQSLPSPDSVRSAIANDTELYSNTNNVKALGNSFRSHPNYPGDSAITSFVSSLNNTNFSDSVLESLRNDYDTLNIFTLEGWVLSKTECYLLAYYSLNS